MDYINKKEGISLEDVRDILAGSSMSEESYGAPEVSCSGVGAAACKESCISGCKESNKAGVVCTEACKPSCLNGCKDYCKSTPK